MLSIFDVIEKLTFKMFDRPARMDDPKTHGLPFDGLKPATIHSIRMTAVWRRDEPDVGKEFDFRTLIHLPGVSEPYVAGEGKFVFKTELYRVIAGFHHDLPQQSGRIVVNSSIRESGTDDWHSQEYVIPVEKLESANQPELPLSDGA